METKKTEVKKTSKIDRVKLSENLKSVNIETLVKKSVKGREIWKKEFKASFDAKNEKRARRLIRNAQRELSRELMSSINLQHSDEILKDKALNLAKFYTTGLIDKNVFSNVSENSKFFAVIHSAVKSMNEILI